ncbi:hypothetical protein F5Y04DRAFT_256723 [Hypomontagnella monticulosa]|nr:hypothetical protein F5Y04DRAFT_256723 [Hypomontagnella monticulosa]
MFRLFENWATRALDRLTIRDAPEPVNEGSDSEEEDESTEDRAPLIKFARFVDGTLELFEARTDELKYVAFSHVWGDWKWRQIPGIPYEVKVSQEKADFIGKDLPGLVGDGAFWMDTLTVDQRNEKEILAIVESIPTIFKMAERTIAVRESDGLYDCCMKTVEGFQNYEEFSNKLSKHHGDHDDYVYNESYIQRLWTLQECLLSHTIQFVVSQGNQPRKRRGKERQGDLNFYRNQIDETIIRDSIWVLAFSFKGSEGVPGISEFLKAYVHGGVVVNPKSPVRTEEEDIYTGQFLRVNLASHRSATMPRDYIFATMPQFPWYKYPKKKAIKMSFGEIYMDLYQQSANAGHAFSCRFTQSMVDPEVVDPVEAWLPSSHQPSPSCLGDFLKLMGHRVPEVSNGLSKHVHVTTVVKVKEFSCHPGPNFVLSALESVMGLFQQQWGESHRGGELSKFGNFPGLDWTLDHVDAMRCGWINKDPEWKLHVLEEGDNTYVGYGPGLNYEEDDLLQNLYSLDEHSADGKDVKEDYVSLFEQTRRILDHMWCAEDPMQRNESQESDWRVFKSQMRTGWSTPLLRTMLLFAAMVVCRVPLSAAGWINRLFVPVYVQYGEVLLTLGLMAKHARVEEAKRDEPRRMYSVGQHLPDKSGATCGLQFGKDIFLVDPKTRVPVGLLPDFLPDERSDQQYSKITSVLYTGLCQVLEGDRVGVMHAPLDAVRESSP